MERTFLIQRFTLLHDGSSQSWPAAYFSFHITARLGALLDVLILNSPVSQPGLDAQIENLSVTARAAKIDVKIHPVSNLSPNTLEENLLSTDSLLVPAHMATSGESAQPLLEAGGCPVWFLYRNMAIRNLALLAVGTIPEQGLFRYASALSKRLQNPLTVLISPDQLPVNQEWDSWLRWYPLNSFSVEDILAALDKIDPSLLFIPAALTSIIGQVNINCVVYPDPERYGP